MCVCDIGPNAAGFVVTDASDAAALRVTSPVLKAGLALVIVAGHLDMRVANLDIVIQLPARCERTSGLILLTARLIRRGVLKGSPRPEHAGW